MKRYIKSNVDNIILKLKKELGSKLEYIIKTYYDFEDYADVYLEVQELYDGNIKIEIRTEFDFDDLMSIANKLHPIIAKYDKDAYFDAETYGVLEAYIRKDEI